MSTFAHVAYLCNHDKLPLSTNSRAMLACSCTGAYNQIASYFMARCWVPDKENNFVEGHIIDVEKSSLLIRYVDAKHDKKAVWIEHGYEMLERKYAKELNSASNKRQTLNSASNKRQKLI